MFSLRVYGNSFQFLSLPQHFLCKYRRYVCNHFTLEMFAVVCYINALRIIYDWKFVTINTIHKGKGIEPATSVLWLLARG